MKYSLTTPSLAAILLVSMSLASCSSRLSDEPEAPENDRRMYVQLAVAPAPETEITDNPGTDAECAIDPERLYIATYKEDGTKITEIFAGAETDDVKFYPSSLWGPSVVTHLSLDDHQDGFYLVAYVLPKSHYTLNGNFTFPANGKTGNFTLSMPGTSGTKATLWAPSDASTGGDQIPMAGVVRITAEEVAKYNPEVHRWSPYRLPAIPMTRAMAKIVIKDVNGNIAKASIATPVAGYAVPDQGWWWDGTGTKVARQVNPDAKTVESTVKNDDNEFIFYVYEKDFRTSATVVQNSTHPRRAITLTADDGSTKDIYVAPYVNGELDESLTTYDDWMTRDGGVWSGILRNHQYVFSVTKPTNGEMEIYVNVGKWTQERKPFEF